MAYSQWGRKQSDMTERLTLTFTVRCKYLCTCVWHVCDLLMSLGSIRLCLLEAGRCSDVQNKRQASPRGPKGCIGDD